MCAIGMRSSPLRWFLHTFISSIRWIVFVRVCLQLQVCIKPSYLYWFPLFFFCFLSIQKVKTHQMKTGICFSFEKFYIAVFRALNGYENKTAISQTKIEFDLQLGWKNFQISAFAFESAIIIAIHFASDVIEFGFCTKSKSALRNFYSFRLAAFFCWTKSGCTNLAWIESDHKI